MRTFARRRSRFHEPREFADKLADAMGEGFDAETATDYARGSGPLGRLQRLALEARSDRQQLLQHPTEEFHP